MSKAPFSSQSVSSSNQGCSSQQAQPNSETKKKVTGTIEFRIAVFFDGTGNNKLNTVARRMVVTELPKKDREELGEIGKDVLTEKQKIAELDELNRAYSYLSEKELKDLIENAKENYKENRKELKKSKTSISYLGAETNVYKMFRDLETCTEPSPKTERAATEWTVFHKLYVEGIGTFGGENDDSIFGGKLGGALAYGDSGIIARVATAKRRVVQFIKNKVDEFRDSIRSGNQEPETIKIKDIYLDFFGFSRGAAAARYACFAFQESNTDTGYALDQDLQVQFAYNPIVEKSFKASIKNVGIFDTVASHGIAGTILEMSDTSFLHLSKSKVFPHLKSIGDAENVFHISAEDEFRVNFALTNNNSKGDRITLPGAHSDIGGGYESVEPPEEKFIVKDLHYREAEAIAIWFQDQGWIEHIYYKSDDGLVKLIKNKENKLSRFERKVTTNQSLDYSVLIVEEDSISDSIISLVNPTFGTLNKRFGLLLKRSTVFNYYAYIPLKLMIDQMTNHSLKFNTNELDTKLKIPIEIAGKERPLEYFVNKVAATPAYNAELVKGLRKKYMHFSGRADTTLGAYQLRANPDDKEHLEQLRSQPFKRKEHDG